MKKNFILISVILAIIFIVFLFPQKTFEISEITKKIENTLNFVENKKEDSIPTQILFVGDMMFDRGVRMKIDQIGFDQLFSGIKEIFERKDLVVGNLEGTITNNKSVAISNNEILRFTFDPSTSSFLKKYNFGLVSLANNHSSDFGKDGYEQTKENLKNSNILFFGSSLNTDNISQKIILNDKNFCFIGYHDLYTKDETPVLKEIKNIKSDCYKIIIFPHWGEEYLVTYTERQKMLAHKFIDEGADLIIGAHPHVVEPVEIYKDKVIFYSIGNFVFDQYFSFETEHSVVVNVVFEEEKTKFEIYPIKIKTGVLSLAVDKESEKTTSALKLPDDTSSIFFEIQK